MHLFSALVIVGLVVYIWKHWGDIEAGMVLSAGKLSFLAMLIFVTWILSSLPMLILARLMHRRIGFWENFAVLVAGMLGNYLPMRMGTIIRMRFFKKVHDLEYTAFIGIMGVRTILLLALTGILGCIGLIGLAIVGQNVSAPAPIAFALMALVSLLILFLPLKPTDQNGTYWGRLLRQLSAGHFTLRDNPKAFCLLVSVMLAQFVILGMRLYISFQVFGLELSVWSLLLLGPAATMVSFVNITPGNLGVKEWIIGGLAGITGMDFQNGVFAGILDRSVLMALTFVIGPICLYYTLRRSNLSRDAEFDLKTEEPCA